MAVIMKRTAFWDIALCRLVEVEMMEAVYTSEMSVYINETTRRYITEEILQFPQEAHCI
jgi:hypothetical protein